MNWRSLYLVPLCFAVGCTFEYTSQSSSHTWTSPHFEVEAREQNGVLVGNWKCDANAFGNSPFTSGTWVNIEIVEPGNNRRTMLGRQLQEIEGLTPAIKNGSANVQFRIQEESGLITFDGQRGEKKYEGNFEFRPDYGFLEETKKYLNQPPTIWELLDFCISRVDLDYVRVITEDQVGSVSARDVLALRRSGVSADYARAMRKAGFSKPTDIVRMRNSGVPIEMVADLKDAGYAYSAEDVVRLRNSGVNAEYAAAWKEGGYNLRAEDLVRLRNSGVPQDYGRALKEVAPNWSPEEIVRLRNSGVTADYIRDVRKAAPNYKPEEIIRLRNSGVTADYLTAWSAAGYSFKPEEIIRLRNSGVPISYAEAMKVEGKEPLDVETLIDLRNRGISPELVKKIRR